MAESFIDIVVRESGFDKLREGADLINDMADAANTLDDTLVDVGEATAESFDGQKKAIKETSDELTNYTNKEKEAANSLKNSAKQYRIFGKSLGEYQAQLKGYVASLRAIGPAMKTAGVGAKAFGLALKAIPIFALIAALTSLVAFMTRTQKGADLLARATAAVGAAMEVVADIFEGAGEKIVDAISNPKQLFEEFSTFLKELPSKVLDNLANRFTALGKTISLLFKGEFQEAAKVSADILTGVQDTVDKVADGYGAIKDKVGEVVNEIKEEVKITDALTVSRQRLRDLNIEFIKTEADLRAEIELQRAISNDVSKSYAEREAAARKAFETENELVRQRLALARENVRIIAAENALSNNLAADNERLATAQAAVANIKSESARLERRLTNEINAINQQKLAYLEAERKKLIELRKAYADFSTLAPQLRQTLNEQLSAVFDEIGANGRPIGETIGNFIDAGIKDATDMTAKDIGDRMKFAAESSVEDFGLTFGDKLSDFFAGVGDFLDSDQFEAFKVVFNSVTEAIVSGINRQIDAIDSQIAKQQEALNETKNQLAEQLENQEKGYANNVDILQEQLRTEEEALQESNDRKAELEKKAAVASAINDSIQQASNLITAGTAIFKAFSSIPIFGVPLAIAAIGAMIGAFAKLKIDAISATTALEDGTNGGAVSDYFSADGAAPHGKSDKGGRKAYRMYDEETGRDMGVRFSGKEAIYDEETTAFFSPLVKYWKQFGELPNMATDSISNEAISASGSTYYSLSSGVTKDDMKAVMTEVMTENLEGHKHLHKGKTNFAVQLDDGRIMVKQGNNIEYLRIR